MIAKRSRAVQQKKKLFFDSQGCFAWNKGVRFLIFLSRVSQNIQSPSETDVSCVQTHELMFFCFNHSLDRMTLQRSDTHWSKAHHISAQGF